MLILGFKPIATLVLTQGNASYSELQDKVLLQYNILFIY